METSCDYCHLPIQADEATSTLLCSHKVHTTCFLKANCADSPQYLQCPNCHTPLCSPAMIQNFVELGVIAHDDIHSDDDGANLNVLNMYQEQEEFRKFIKDYHKQLCKVSKLQRSLNKLVREEKKQFNENMKEIKEAIQNESKQHYKKVTSGPNYKSFIRENRKFFNLRKELKETYHLTQSQVSEYLHNVPGFKRWPFVFRRRYYNLKYSFRLHI